MVSDGIENAEKACISKHFLASDVTSRCRFGATPKRGVEGSSPFWDVDFTPFANNLLCFSFANGVPLFLPIFLFSMFVFQFLLIDGRTVSKHLLIKSPALLIWYIPVNFDVPVLHFQEYYPKVL